MTFTVTDNSVFDDNPELKTIEEFKELPDRTLKWIFLTYDYKSPYRNLPIPQRKDKAAFHVGFRREKERNRWDKTARHIMDGHHQATEKAKEKFKELIYDSDMDTLQSIDELIENIREFIRKPDAKGSEMEKKVKLAEKLPDLTETRKKLAQLLEINTEEVEVESKNELSTLELVLEGKY